MTKQAVPIRAKMTSVTKRSLMAGPNMRTCQTFEHRQKARVLRHSWGAISAELRFLPLGVAPMVESGRA